MRQFAAIVATGLIAALAVTAAPPVAADDATPAPTAPAEVTAPPSTPATEPVPPTPPVEPVPVEPAPPIAPPAAPPAAPPVAKPPVKKVVNSPLPLRRGARGWRVSEVQERLAWLGYPISPIDTKSDRVWTSTTKAIQKFQSKFGYQPTGVVGPGTWDLLRKTSGTVGKLPSACLSERSLCIDKSTRLLRLVDHGKVLLTLDARFGMPGLETREGSFRVSRKSRDHVSSLFHSWMPFAMFFSGGQAVHYSPFFARDGYNGGSHGCIGVRDFKAAEWLFDRVSIGTRVQVYWS